MAYQKNMRMLSTSKKGIIVALICSTLFLCLFLTSCMGNAYKENGELQSRVSTYDKYVGNIINLGLAENETILDIIEVDGELRATIGVETWEIEGIVVSGVAGTPHITEHRYYDMDFVENAEKRQKTSAPHEASVY
ncbi:MAG: hypothetical protein IJF34_10695, partial [Clostridia bacterium]|nr:hypothetical protein [Clostridia bacterium]